MKRLFILFLLILTFGCILLADYLYNDKLSFPDVSSAGYLGRILSEDGQHPIDFYIGRTEDAENEIRAAVFDGDFFSQTIKLEPLRYGKSLLEQIAAYLAAGAGKPSEYLYRQVYHPITIAGRDNTWSLWGKDVERGYAGKYFRNDGSEGKWILTRQENVPPEDLAYKVSSANQDAFKNWVQAEKMRLTQRYYALLNGEDEKLVAKLKQDREGLRKELRALLSKAETLEKISLEGQVMKLARSIALRETEWLRKNWHSEEEVAGRLDFKELDELLEKGNTAKQNLETLKQGVTSLAAVNQNLRRQIRDVHESSGSDTEMREMRKNLNDVLTDMVKTKAGGRS